MENSKARLNPLSKFAVPSFQRYASLIQWLIVDSVWRYKKLVVFILITGFLSVAFQAQVFGFIVIYSRHFASGKLIDWGPFSVNPRTSVNLLCAGSLVVITSLLLSAIGVFLSKRSILIIGIRYETFCAKRIFSLLSIRSYDFISRASGRGPDNYLLRLVKSDSRMAGRVLRLILSLIIPIITLIVAFSALVYLNPTLTLAILFFGIGYLMFQKKVSKKAANFSIRAETLAPLVSQGYRKLIQHFKLQPENHSSKELVEETFKSNNLRDELDAYEGRLLAVEKSRLGTGLFTAMAIGLIILVMGGNIIRVGSGWDHLLIFVIALRFALSSLQSSFAIITSINRFYPQIRRYFQFLKNVEEELHKKPKFESVYEVQIAPDIPPAFPKGNVSNLVLMNGVRLALVTQLELNRYTISALSRSILGQSDLCRYNTIESMRFAIANHSYTGMTLRQMLNLAPDAKWTTLNKWFPDQNLLKLANDQLPNSLDKVISSKNWSHVDAKLKIALSMISAACADSRWIWVDAKDLNLIEKMSAGFYLDRFDDRILVLCYNKNLKMVGRYGEKIVAFAHNEKLLSMGTTEWFLGEYHNFAKALRLDVRKTRKAKESDPEEDLDYEV